MNIEELINKGEYNDFEKSKLKNIDLKLKEHNNEFTYHIDSNVTSAKCRYNDRKILLTNYNYSIIIHELLHAELMFVKNYPSLERIYSIESKICLRNRMKFIKDFTNDLHHLIFYKDFDLLTQHCKSRKFVCNERVVTNVGIGDTFQIVLHGIRNTTNKEERLNQFYNRGFIRLQYRKLLFGDNIDKELKKLEELEPILLSAFNQITVSLINLKKIDKSVVIKLYTDFFREIDLFLT
ncbi:MAG: hypothetical protein JXA53_08310 [Bacteroidales bacterium]|nr:hypothetical protein [Bacteroidales bacterium]